MKMKNLTQNMKNYEQLREDAKCVACNGSGYYDSYDFENDRAYECDSCNGTGLENGGY